MKKPLLMLFVLCLIGNIANAQLSLKPSSPPFGYKFDLCTISSAAALTKPSSGPNKMWVYNIANVTASYPYEVVDPASVPANYITPVPATDYVVRMKIAPTPEQDPMDFYDNTGTAVIRIGQKGSNSNPPDVKNDTLIHSNMVLGQGLKNSATERIYYAWGNLTINNDVFDSVAVVKQHYIGMADTAYYFFQTKPHFHYIGILVYTNANMKAMQYYKPSRVTAVEQEQSLKTKVYPNPSEGHYTIQLDRAESMNYEVFNVNGQLVHSGASEENNTHKIDLRELPKGIYTLKMLIVNGTSVQKLLKY